MRPTLADHYSSNGRATNGTGLAGTAIDPEMVLKTAASVNPINASTVVINTRLQDRSNAMQQFLRFG